MNQVRLSARVVECPPLRFTPAGIPVLDLVLEHESEVVEAGRARRVAMTLPALAVGDLARRLAHTALGQPLEIEGFLAPTRKGSSRLRLHVRQALPMSAAGQAVPGNTTD